MDANGVVEMKDFSLPGGLEPKKFKVDNDVFLLSPQIPIGLLGEVAKLSGLVSAALSSTDDAEQAVASIRDVFGLFMFPESLDRFTDRLRSRTEPIGLPQIQNILPWLLEAYALRPTAQPSGSSNGSAPEGDSTSLTDGALDTAVSAGLANPLPGLISQPGVESTSSIDTSASS